ncbi:MAG: hypothetical protein JO092_04105 [Candidatus Eremiobacteraeota bacterium]|nr:hypothetical protein [Candidatus Eremiobacteraeota bacterium]
MKLRLGACFAAALFLAACQGFSNSNSSSAIPRQNLQAKFPAARATPAYSLEVVIPDHAMPSLLASGVGSVRATTFVKKKRYNNLIEAPIGCSLSVALAPPGKVAGCKVLFAGTQAIKIRLATFVAYKRRGGTGCTLATASFTGTATYDSTVASIYKPEHTKTCW